MTIKVAILFYGRDMRSHQKTSKPQVKTRFMRAVNRCGRENKERSA